MTQVTFGSPAWTYVAAIALIVAMTVVIWNYSRARTKGWVRLTCATLKTVGFTALVFSLVEPLLSGTRPRKGANIFVILADNSQSLSVRDSATGQSRGRTFQELITKESEWKTKLSQDFDVRHYQYDSQLRTVGDEHRLTFDGTASTLEASLIALRNQFRGLPLAGVLLLTDGNRTDPGILAARTDVQGSKSPQLPPIFPVLLPESSERRDIAVQKVTASQTNFESAPAIVNAIIKSTGFEGQEIVASLVSEDGKEIERQQATQTSSDQTLHFRFQFRPDNPHVNFYRIRVFPLDEESNYLADTSRVHQEQTLANNEQLFVIKQGRGPYRVLYVGGRPNWEYKFLRRAIDWDEQVDLIGLLRIAKKQPKFDFQRSGNRETSPLFDGFDDLDEELAEQSDQPVLVRIGTRDEVELRDGFPRTAADLFRYHAVILDDLEADFFTQDQLSLMREFVSVRGGGLLMLGGASSFAEGHYDRTPVEELLPVYLNRSHTRAISNRGNSAYRFSLTREGWLQSWTRTERTETAEKKRLAEMPAFSTLNKVGPVKPGAFVLAEVQDESDRYSPALVAHQFGKGHVGALLLGDFWRWAMDRRDPKATEFNRFWRQTIRWLLSDVPEQVELSIEKAVETAPDTLRLETRVRDDEFRLLDNAQVTIRVVPPNGDEFVIDAEPHERESGLYTAIFRPKEPGAFRFVATAISADRSPIGKCEEGWAAQPGAEEFVRLTPDREYLEELAVRTDGELIEADRIAAFVDNLSFRDAPITEPWTAPLWHQPWYFLIAIGCLISEWGLRRVNGLS